MRLTKRNYFSIKANREYMSVSQFKNFEKCPAAALAEVNGKFEREKTVALLVGSYVDAYIEGTLDDFKKQNQEIFKKDGTLKAEYLQAESIIARMERDKLFSSYFVGKKQVIMTGTINGVPIKIKIDNLMPDRIVDYKIVKDFEPIYDTEKGILPWWEFWGYDLQGAVYQEIVYQKTGKRLPFHLAAATKEKITDIDIVNIQQDTLDIAREHVKQNVELYDAIKQGIIEPYRCEKCAYCKMTKQLTAPTESDEFLFL